MGRLTGLEKLGIPDDIEAHGPESGKAHLCVPLIAALNLEMVLGAA